MKKWGIFALLSLSATVACLAGCESDADPLDGDTTARRAALTPTLSAETTPGPATQVEVRLGTGFPLVESSGTGFLVLLPSSTSVARATRVAADGTVLDPTGISIFPNRTGAAGGLAFNGTHYLMTWIEWGTQGTSIWAARLATDGTVVDTTPIAVAPFSTNPRIRDVASNGQDFFVAWLSDANSQSERLFGARIDAAGTNLDPGGILIDGPRTAIDQAKVASDGTDWLVFWNHESPDNQLASRIDAQGQLLGQTDVGPDGSIPVEAIYHAGNYLLAYDAPGSDYEAQYLDSSGVTGATFTFPTSFVPHGLVSDGTDLIAHGNLEWSDVLARVYRLRTDGTQQDPGRLTPFSTVGSFRVGTDAAFDGTNFLVATIGGNARSQLIDLAGSTVLDRPRLLATGPTGQYEPEIASNGSGYLAVWRERREVGVWVLMMARFDANGVSLDPSGIAITTPSTEIIDNYEVASDGQSYLITWNEFDSSTARNYHALHVPDTPGSPQDQSWSFESVEDGSDPVVSGFSNTFLVAWGSERGIEASLIEPGSPSSPRPILASTSADQGGELQVVNDGTRFMIQRDNEVVRVAKDGSILDAIPRDLPLPAGGRVEKLAWAGTNYIATWDIASDFYAGRITSDGTLLDPNGVLLPRPIASREKEITFDGIQPVLFWENGRDGFSHALRLSSNLQPVDSFAHNFGSDIPSTSRVAAGAVGDVMSIYSKRNPQNGRQEVLLRKVEFNVPPRGQSATYTVAEDGSLTFTLQGSDVDNDPLTYVIESPPGGGTLSGAAPDLTYTPNPDFSGDVFFRYAVSDGAEQGPSSRVDIVVTPENDPPEFVSNPMLTAPEDSTYLYEIEVDDVDGDDLTVTASALPDWLSFVQDQGQSQLVGEPEMRHLGSHAVVLEVSDAEFTVEQRFDVEVVNANDAPSFTSTPVDVAIQDELYTYDITASDDDGDALLLEGDWPAWLDLAEASEGWTLSGTPGADDLGIHPVELRLSDASASVTQSFEVDVQDANDPPEFVEPTPAEGSDFVWLEGETVQLQFAAEDPEGDILSYEISPTPGTASFDAERGFFTWTPRAEDAGEYEFELSVSDGEFSAQRRFNATVNFIDRDEDGEPDTLTEPLESDPIAPEGEDGGCGCSASNNKPGGAALLLLIAFLGLRTRRTRFAALLVSAACIVGCADAPDTDVPEIEDAEQEALDFESIRGQTVLAYRPSSEGFEARADTYKVEATGGAFSVSPSHFDMGLTMNGAMRAEPATFETTSIRRSHELNHFAGSRVADDGHLMIDRTHAIEHVRNSATDLEQSWSFATKPEGGGDLVVEVSVTGQKFVDTSASGLHFEDPTSGIGIRYSHGIWIDADGNRTSLEARWTGRGIELRVPESVIESSAFPAVLDPTLSAEIGLSDPVWVPRPYSWAPEVAFNGSIYLMVWQYLDSLGNHTLASRIDLAGNVVDPGGFEFINSGFGGALGIASDGTDFLVTWIESAASSRYEVRAARIDASGNVLDPIGLQVSQPVSGYRDASVVWDGTNYVVSWAAEGSASARVYARRLSPSGSFVDAIPILVDDDAPPSILQLESASNGNGSLLAYSGAWPTDPPYLPAVRLSSQGTVLDDPPIQLTGGRSPRLASNGTDYLVVSDLTNDTVVGQRVTATGAAPDSTGFLIGNGQGSDVASNQGSWLVSWSDSGIIRAAEVSAAGVLSGTTTIITAGDRESRIIPGPAGEHLVVSGKQHFGDSITELNFIRGRRVDQNLTPLAPTDVLTFKPRIQRYPQIANDGSNFLVIWREGERDERDIRGARIDASGNLLDAAGFDIASDIEDASKAALTHDGTNFLVVWEDASNVSIRGARVDSSGVVLDPGGFEIAPNASDLWQLVPAWGETLVVRGDGRLIPVDSQANVGPIWQVSLTNVESATYASSGSELLGLFKLATSTSLRAAIVPPNLMVSNPLTFGEVGLRKIVFDGENFVVLFEEMDGSFVRRLSPQAAAVDTNPVPLAVRPFDMVSDGKLSLAVTGTNSGSGLYRRSQYEATRISRGLRTLDTTPINLGLSDGRIAIDSLEPGKFMTVRPVDTLSPYGSTRIKARLLTVNIPPEAQSATVALDEDSSVSVTLAATDHEGSALSYSVVTGPENGTLSGSAPSLVYTPEPDFNGMDSLTFVADDGEDESDPATIQIDVAAVNDPSTLNQAPLTATQDQPFEHVLTTEDIEGDVPTITAVSLPPWLSFTDSQDGTGVLEGTPANDDVGVHELRFELDDGAATSTAEVTITVENVNDAPVFVSEPVTTALQHDLYEYRVEVEDPDGDEVTVEVVSLPSWLSFEALSDGARITGIPVLAPDEVQNVRLEATDGQASSQQAFEIMIEARNLEPTWVPPTPEEGALFTVFEGELLELQFLADDRDSPVFYQALDGPPRAGLGVSSGKFEWTPTLDEAGDWEMVVEASDQDHAIQRTVRFRVDFVDSDRDGFPDSREEDEGLDPSNPDTDGDGIVDGEDICPTVSNPRQADADEDGLGNECDSDFEEVDEGCGCRAAQGPPPSALLYLLGFLILRVRSSVSRKRT